MPACTSCTRSTSAMMKMADRAPTTVMATARGPLHPQRAGKQGSSFRGSRDTG